MNQAEHTEAPGQSKRPPPQVRIRTHTDDDLACIYDSWIRGYRYSREGRGMRAINYQRWMRGLVDRILARDDTNIRIAAGVTKPDLIHGWVCWTRVGVTPVLHWLYVKKHYRGFGIGRLLAAFASIEATTSLMYTFSGHDAVPLSSKVAAATYIPVEEFLL